MSPSCSGTKSKPSAGRQRSSVSVQLTIATTDYDHFRDFRLGLVRAEGIEANWLTLGHHEIFSRFPFNREWDVSELSFAKFTAQVTRENSDIVGLPVYASRLFRFSSFYVVAPDHHRKASVALRSISPCRQSLSFYACAAAQPTIKSTSAKPLFLLTIVHLRRGRKSMSPVSILNVLLITGSHYSA